MSTGIGMASLVGRNFTVSGVAADKQAFTDEGDEEFCSCRRQKTSRTENE